MIGQAQRVNELNNLRRASKRKEEGCPIVAITSGKGGTGKSFVSLNLAYALARNNKKILLVDLDANLSNINIMLNIKPEKTIYEFLQNSAFLKELIHFYEPNLHFIFGESGKIDHPQFNDSNLSSFFYHLNLLSEDYDYIFLDLASGAGPDIINVLVQSDIKIVVTNPEPTSIMDAYVVLKLISRQGNKKSYAVINKSASLKEGNVAFDNLNKAVKHFLKSDIELLGIIEFNNDVSQSILNQKLFIKNYPEVRVSIQLKQLAAKIGKIKQVANSNQ
ncbi:MAG: AAA family ATPase [Ignavibacteria bacterium]|jgi:flagellar biosynthesis protein FlhG